MKKSVAFLLIFLIFTLVLIISYCEKPTLFSETVSATEPSSEAKLPLIPEEIDEVEPVISSETLADETTEDETESTAYYKSIAENITQEEIDMLAKLVYLEARGESLLGQRAVVEVVLNRVLDDEFPDTIEDVIYQKNQFSPSGLISSTTATETQYQAVDMVLNEQYPVLDAGVVYFSMGQYNNYLFEKIGCHYFCYSERYFN